MSNVRKPRDVQSSEAPQNRKRREKVRLQAEKNRAKAEERRAKDVKAVLSRDTHKDPPSDAAGEAGGKPVG
ncbi:MAG TPA: hypothetical protein VLH75_08110 [Longimicrobiales bacterium]|nr:hypothetical protein [Longimicrobiales bacterium]